MDALLLFAALSAPTWFDVEEDVAPPSPPPVTGCQCGCGRESCHCGRPPRSVAAASCSNTRVSLHFEPTASVAANWSPQRTVIIYSQPHDTCAPCKAQYAMIGDGDADVLADWQYTDFPPFVTSTPTFYDPTSRRYWSGQMTLDQLRRWVGLPAESLTAAPAAPATVGRVQGREAIDSALAAVAQYLGAVNALQLEQGRTIDLGSAAVVIPAATSLRWDLSRATKRLEFRGAKPELRALGLKVYLDGITYDGRTLTALIPRFPDWSFRVE